MWWLVLAVAGGQWLEIQQRRVENERLDRICDLVVRLHELGYDTTDLENKIVKNFYNRTVE